MDPLPAGRRYDEVVAQSQRKASWRSSLPYGPIVSVSPFVLSVEQFFDRTDVEHPYEPICDDDGVRMTTARWRARPVKEFDIDSLVAVQYELGANQLQYATEHPADRVSFVASHPVVVIVYKGVNYLLDGHHRTLAERLAGNTTVMAHYIVRNNPGNCG